jgi:hypothetical protein
VPVTPTQPRQASATPHKWAAWTLGCAYLYGIGTLILCFSLSVYNLRSRVDSDRLTVPCNYSSRKTCLHKPVLLANRSSCFQPSTFTYHHSDIRTPSHGSNFWSNTIRYSARMPSFQLTVAVRESVVDSRQYIQTTNTFPN